MRNIDLLVGVTRPVAYGIRAGSIGQSEFLAPKRSKASESWNQMRICTSSLSSRLLEYRQSGTAPSTRVLNRTSSFRGRVRPHPSARRFQDSIRTVRSIFNLRHDKRMSSIFRIGRVSSLETGSSVSRNLRSGTVRYLGQRKYISLLN